VGYLETKKFYDFSELQVAMLWINLAVHARDAKELDNPLSNTSNGVVC